MSEERETVIRVKKRGSVWFEKKEAERDDTSETRGVY